MKKISIFLAVCVIIAASFFAYQKMKTPDQCSTGHMATLQTPNQILTVSIAQTASEQAKGLGGCPALDRYKGMYFPFSTPSPQTFWMKNMIMPIDIVWISGGNVVGIESRVPFLPSGTNDALLPLYHSPQNVDAVLEIGSGMADSYGLVQGAHVALEP